MTVSILTIKKARFWGSGLSYTWSCLEIPKRFQRLRLFLQFCDPLGQARNLARSGVFVEHALGNAPHDFGLGGLQCGQGRSLVALGNGLFHLADEAADAGLARGVDRGALGGGADAL